MTIITARYGQISVDDQDHFDLQQAKQFLQSLEEDGQCYALGIYDPASNIIYIPENMDIAGKDHETVLEQKKESFSGLNLQIDKIEFYDQGN